jgi:hypothetical protein
VRVLKALGVLHLLGLVGLLTRAQAHGSATDVATKWATNLANAQQSMTDGVQRVTVAPGASAAAAKQKWVAKMTSVQTQNKWAQNVAAVSLGSWQSSMTTLGIQRAAAGAQAKQQKMVNAMTKLLPFIDQLRSTVSAMPDVTTQDREQRMLAWTRGMAQFPGVGS